MLQTLFKAIKLCAIMGGRSSYWGCQDKQSLLFTIMTTKGGQIITPARDDPNFGEKADCKYALRKGPETLSTSSNSWLMSNCDATGSNCKWEEKRDYALNGGVRHLQYFSLLLIAFFLTFFLFFLFFGMGWFQLPGVFFHADFVK